MEKIVILSCLAAVGYAIFFPLINLPNQRQMMNVCIYSNNPVRYQPKCFLCPSSVYQNVLRACVNAAAIPSNVSYTQAACIEQNCMIRRGKRSIDDLQPPHNLLESDHSPMPLSPNSNQVAVQKDGKNPRQDTKFDIVGTEEFYASDYADYENEDSESQDED